MNYHDLTRLLIKIMGLFILAWSISSGALSMGTVVWSYRDHGIAYPLGFIIIPIFIALAIGGVLFLGDRRIANAIVFQTSDDDDAAKTDFRRLEQIGIALLGLYLTAMALKSLLGISVSTIGALLREQDPRLTSSYSYLLEYSFQLGIGLAIFLCSNGIATLRQRILEFRDTVRNLDN